MAYAGSYNQFFAALRQRESGNDYKAVNGYGYIGAYQFGEAALIDLGYVVNDGSAFNNDFSGGFTGKNGVDSRSEFLNTPSAQDKAAEEWFELLWDRIVYYDLDTYAGQTLNGVELTKSGMIAASHLLGTGGLRDFIQSGGTDAGSDAYNTQITEYLELFENYRTPSSFKDDRSADNDLDGGKGSDRLFGRGGDDSLAGAAGKDKLSGGAGRDKLLGGGGDDQLFGGDGKDRLFGGGGDDNIKGGGGRDKLVGGGGRDGLFGKGGDDRLTGGDRSDKLVGGGGNDLLFGGKGTDTACFSGDRDDFIVKERKDGSVKIIDTTGNLGTDILIDIEQVKFGGMIFDIEDLL